MLALLFGNQNIERTLLFTLVNGSCYGMQLHRLLGVPLTPLQKALQRLEKAQVLTGRQQGKTVIYQFNPAYPLLSELETLLQKAYSQLSPEEKRRYYVRVDTQQREGRILLETIWQRLKGMKHVAFETKTDAMGRGEVAVSGEKEGVLIYQEKGRVRTEKGQENEFSNVFRWTLDLSAGVISLEHLRRGMNHPVFLCHLAPAGPDYLESTDPHLCVQDSYFARLTCLPKSLHLYWRVLGPEKNEEMHFYYN